MSSGPEKQGIFKGLINKTLGGNRPFITIPLAGALLNNAGYFDSYFNKDQTEPLPPAPPAVEAPPAPSFEPDVYDYTVTPEDLSLGAISVEICGSYNQTAIDAMELQDRDGVVNGDEQFTGIPC